MDRKVGVELGGRPVWGVLRSHLPAFIAHVSASLVLTALLLAAAQPVMTDDAWWHLAMGGVYTSEGPWLDADPLLHTATQAAAPASWLADVSLYAASHIAGIQGLRLVHAAVVFAILALGCSLLYRTSRSAIFASLGTVLFANLAAYRLVQLRPHLLTMLAVLVLIHLVATRRDRPTWWGAAAIAGLFVLWANSHAAFVLGPALLGAGLAGLVVADVLGAERSSASRARAIRFGVLFLVASAVTLLNPEGPDQLLHYFVAGDASPALEIVRDEWAPLRLLTWPKTNLPPSVLAWGIAWGLVAALPVFVGLDVRRRRGAAFDDARRMSETEAQKSEDLDPALAAMALVSLVAMIAAVRFLWLGVVPLAMLGQVLAARSASNSAHSTRMNWAMAITLLLLVPASFRLGDWPMISKGVAPGRYSRAFTAMKYHAHSVWFLADAGLEGNLFNSYFMGNFLGYWLAPEMKAFVNGSLNLSPDAMADGQAAMSGRSRREGESLTEMLDRHHVDVFVGEGMPVRARTNRPADFTTTHLDAEPGWILVFRNVHGSLHVRGTERNRNNLQRVAEYYERAGVPFDPVRGFIIADVVQRAPKWAEAHALVPSRFALRQRAARSADPMTRRAAEDDLASLYLLIGEYGRASSLLQKVARSEPGSPAPLRRLVWSLLHEARYKESVAAARTLLEVASPGDALSLRIAEVAISSETVPEAKLRARVATLPVFTRPEMRAVFYGYREPEARPLRLSEMPR